VSGDMDYSVLVGEKVIAVDGATLYLEDGRAFRFGLEGDCCSSSDYTPEGLATPRHPLPGDGEVRRTARRLLRAVPRDEGEDWGVITLAVRLSDWPPQAQHRPESAHRG
jgi:hypothetical protein